MKRFFLALSVLILSAFVPLSASAAQAQDVSGTQLVTAHLGFDHVGGLFDGNVLDRVVMHKGASFTVSYEEGFGSAYLIFDVEPGSYTVTDEKGTAATFGEKGFLHEYLDLQQAFGGKPKQLTFSFAEKAPRINEVYLFSEGDVPDFVQRWEEPLEDKTDLVLFSAHGDDEQLFFAGLLPYYAAERDCRVQVVYLTDHRNLNTYRCHEMLNGLWAVGVRSYPVFGGYPDYYSLSGDKALSGYVVNKKATWESLVDFTVEQLRRFKPKVVVTHDLINGEYGHGMHILYARMVEEAVQLSMEESAYPETAQRYGLWDVPKTYFHLYPENAITMDYDQPLQSFDGMTAFEVTKYRGWPCHVSQQVDFSWYMEDAATARQVEKYNPCYYGLFRTTVGEDEKKNDFFEHVTTYAEDAAELERQKAEAERERAAIEASRAAEAAGIEVETRQENILENRQHREQQQRTFAILTGSLFSLAAVLAIFVLLKKIRKK